MSAADPAIVLGDLLGQEDLALKLLSGGEDALRRPIAGAHAVELESPTRFLAKDWILLSAGPRLRGHRQAQRELVAELDEAGATAPRVRDRAGLRSGPPDAAGRGARPFLPRLRGSSQDAVP